MPAEYGGAEIYARRLIPALLGERPELRLSVFCATEALPVFREEAWAAEVELVHVPVRARSRARRVLAEQTLLPRAVRRARVDLLHNLVTTAPALPGAPQVTTILDVIYKRFPETHAGVLAHGLRLLVPLAARRSRRVVTISEASKEDIVRFLGVDPGRVDVTYLGPGLPDAEPVPEPNVRSRLGLGEAPIVLTVSAKRPHKNLGRLLDAVARQREAVLVVPGYETPWEAELRSRSAALGLGERVRFAGWIDDALLAGLYGAATCFVFPSLAEGFGLPVLDAMRRGVPVACSSATSLPEVGGEAVLYFDPLDAAAIADALGRLLEDTPLREKLAAAGRKQAERFSWAETARGTLESYERALSSRS